MLDEHNARKDDARQREREQKKDERHPPFQCIVASFFGSSRGRILGRLISDRRSYL